MIRCGICGASTGSMTRSLAIEAGWIEGRGQTHSGKNGRKCQPILVCPKCTEPFRTIPKAAT